MILAPGQPIPHGQPYYYHPNRPVHMMTARKRVGPLPTHRLAVRHLVDYSSSDHFTSDDSSRDSSSSSSSETSLDYPSDDLHDSSSILSIPRSFGAVERPSHSSVAGPSRKRSRSSDFVIDLEGCLDEGSESSVPRETSLRDDVVVRARGIDARVVVEAVDQEEIKTGMRGPIEVRFERVTHPAVLDDIPEPAQEEGAVEVTYKTLGDLGHRIVATGQQSAVLSERISELERDNMRLRGTLDVASQRVSRLQRK
ncbi:hypothetical protein Tco_1477812, partial [Tanacetum coccineum]